MEAAVASPVTGKATRREWTGLAAIALPCMVYAMDLTVLNLALPAISADLRPSSAQLLWIVDIYGFMVAGFLITMGTLGDRIGRRRLLLIGAAAFAAASLAAAFSRSAEMLIAMRALLGVAGATLAPSTMSLIRSMFHDEHERRLAIGIWVASFSLGGAIGPLVGGVMLELFAWGSVFFVAVPVMALLLLVGPWLLPEYRDPEAGRLDPVSVLQSLAAVLAIVYGFKSVATEGLGYSPLLCILAGIAAALLFVRRQSRLAYPLLDTTLFREPAFAAAIAAYGLASLAMMGMYIFISQYLQLVLQLSPLKAGLATLPWSVAFVVGSLATPRLARRWSRRAIVVSGLAMAAIGFGLLAVVGESSGLAALLAGTVVTSLGMAPVFTLGNDIIVTTAPAERAGAASALSETSSEFSGALGIALFGSIGTVLYRRALSRDVADVPSAAMETLGGAVTAAANLSGPQADALLIAARSAFVDAMQFVAFGSAAIMVAAAVFSARMLARPP